MREALLQLQAEGLVEMQPHVDDSVKTISAKSLKELLLILSGLEEMTGADHFLLPTERTSLRAIGRLLKPGKRQDIAEMHLYDGQGRLVGHAIGSFIVLPTIPLR